MTTTDNPLKRSLQGMQDQPRPTLVQSTTPKAGTSPNASSRQGKKQVAGHFDPEVVRQLKLLTIERDATIQALLAEALNDLFKKYGKSAVA